MKSIALVLVGRLLRGLQLLAAQELRDGDFRSSGSRRASLHHVDAAAVGKPSSSESQPGKNKFVSARANGPDLIKIFIKLFVVASVHSDCTLKFSTGLKLLF